MPLSPRNTRTFHRHLYAGMLQKITLLKRYDDQSEGSQRVLTLFDCREKKIAHTGQPIAGTMGANDFTVWQLPRIELDRVGVTEINPLDRIIGADGQMWQPESEQLISIQLFKNIVNCDCRRVS